MQKPFGCTSAVVCPIVLNFSDLLRKYRFQSIPPDGYRDVNFTICQQMKSTGSFFSRAKGWLGSTAEPPLPFIGMFELDMDEDNHLYQGMSQT